MCIVPTISDDYPCCKERIPPPATLSLSRTVSAELKSKCKLHPVQNYTAWDIHVRWNLSQNSTFISRLNSSFPTLSLVYTALLYQYFTIRHIPYNSFHIGTWIWGWQVKLTGLDNNLMDRSCVQINSRVSISWFIHARGSVHMLHYSN